MEKRKLASIQYIHHISPIEGADRIECIHVLGLNMVPIEELGTVFDYDNVEDLLERAKGKYSSGVNKEGIVVRPTEPVYSSVIEGPLSMKVLNNDYLLKE